MIRIRILTLDSVTSYRIYIGYCVHVGFYQGSCLYSYTTKRYSKSKVPGLPRCKMHRLPTCSEDQRNNLVGQRLRVFFVLYS